MPYNRYHPRPVGQIPIGPLTFRDRTGELLGPPPPRRSELHPGPFSPQRPLPPPPQLTYQQQLGHAPRPRRPLPRSASAPQLTRVERWRQDTPDALDSGSAEVKDLARRRSLIPTIEGGATRPAMGSGEQRTARPAAVRQPPPPIPSAAHEHAHGLPAARRDPGSHSRYDEQGAHRSHRARVYPAPAGASGSGDHHRPAREPAARTRRDNPEHPAHGLAPGQQLPRSHSHSHLQPGSGGHHRPAHDPAHVRRTRSGHPESTLRTAGHTMGSRALASRTHHVSARDPDPDRYFPRSRSHQQFVPPPPPPLGQWAGAGAVGRTGLARLPRQKDPMSDEALQAREKSRAAMADKALNMQNPYRSKAALRTLAAAEQADADRDRHFASFPARHPPARPVPRNRNTPRHTGVQGHGHAQAPTPRRVPAEQKAPRQHGHQPNAHRSRPKDQGSSKPTGFRRFVRDALGR
jgi:hypothetical protein